MTRFGMNFVVLRKQYKITSNQEPKVQFMKPSVTDGSSLIFTAKRVWAEIAFFSCLLVVYIYTLLLVSIDSTSRIINTCAYVLAICRYPYMLLTLKETPTRHSQKSKMQAIVATLD